MKRYGLLLITLLLIGCYGAARAEPPPANAIASAPADPVAAQLFPPDLVMRHQREIALSDEQRTAIQRDVERTQQDMGRLSWDLAAARERLVTALAGASVDERRALELANAVMELETRVKRSHLTLLVRIKNQLRSEQQRRLRELR